MKKAEKLSHISTYQDSSINWKKYFSLGVIAISTLGIACAAIFGLNSKEKKTKEKNLVDRVRQLRCIGNGTTKADSSKAFFFGFSDIRNKSKIYVAFDSGEDGYLTNGDKDGAIDYVKSISINTRTKNIKEKKIKLQELNEHEKYVFTEAYLDELSKYLPGILNKERRYKELRKEIEPKKDLFHLKTTPLVCK